MNATPHTDSEDLRLAAQAAGGSLHKTIGKKPVIEIPAKTIINFKSGFGKKLLCDGATFSTGTACVYSCAFCYVPDAMRKLVKPTLDKLGMRHDEVVIRRAGAVERLKVQLSGLSAARRFNGSTIYASPLVDVAATMELARETAEACRVILRETDWNIRLLSKSTFLPVIADELRNEKGFPKKRIIFGVSTGTRNDKLAKSFELGCPAPSKRMESIRWLQSERWRTFGMICPMLPMGRGEMEEMVFEILQGLGGVNCLEHVWAEPLNARGDSMERTVAGLEAGGFMDYARRLRKCAEDARAWEDNARLSFCVTAAYVPPTKLRFLQYVTNENRAWWTAHEQLGAVLL